MPLTASFTQLLDIVAALRVGPGGASSPSTDEQVAAMLQFSRNRTDWGDWLMSVAADDELTSYVWLSFACDSMISRSIGVEDALARAGNARQTPLLTFDYLTACERGNSQALQALVRREPRFAEAEYLLGLAALGRRPRSDVDTADERFHLAYAWRQDWPSLTLSIGNLALTTEDFARAFEFFDHTLALIPEQPDALVGTIRALAYLGRYTEALETTDLLLATGRNPGEARYWRAFNENQLERYDDAWSDIEIARTLIVNAEVPKLAGVIAYRRGEGEVARRQFEEARTRNPADCETGFYLQSVLAEQRNWSDATTIAVGAARCFDDSEVELRRIIESLRSSGAAPDRLARQVARREQDIASNSRMRAAAWFNAAVATFNLGRQPEAREFATKVADDEQFGERAKALLSRLQ